MDSITQDMKYRYSLMKYAETYGVSRASRKYNKTRSYIYFWKARFDGSIESLACQSRRPHSHPNQHTESELKLISDMYRRNPKLGIVELWSRLRKRGYSRCIESLWRVMRREGMAAKEKPKKKYCPSLTSKCSILGSVFKSTSRLFPEAALQIRNSNYINTPRLMSIPDTVFLVLIPNKVLILLQISSPKSQQLFEERA